MFPKTKLNAYAKLMGLSTVELEEFARRTAALIQKKQQHQIITKNVILNSLFILEDIKGKNKRIENNVPLINYGNIQKAETIKFAPKILELHAQGMGGKRIAKHLKLNHRVKISPSSVFKLIRLNENEWTL